MAQYILMKRFVVLGGAACYLCVQAMQRRTDHRGKTRANQSCRDKVHHKETGMVHAWVSQKRLKRDILRLFTMSDLLNI